MNNNNFDTFNFEIFASVNEMFKNEMKKNDDTLANKNFYSKMIILKFKDGVVTFLTKLEKEIAESWLKKKKSLIIRVLNKILDSNVNTIVYKCEKNNKESVVTAQVKLPIDKEIYEPTASDLTGESKRQQTLLFWKNR
ncbi:hypothetical protein [Mycoplasmopsis columbinasalis]|uniref:Uncharacterized protein n=1 Tax=Mycoplasmopsis columbinasalis TaxID=114880 RepID=A0A449BAA7_9BACT|nr:hypothetical protein [Mycoplasmopsis columbinasalis]VEU78122.1 Uncharacterised protein [Mycoplasmopsis columbinasalis]